MKKYLKVTFVFLIISNGSLFAQEKSFFSVSQVSVQPFLSTGFNHLLSADNLENLTGGNHGLPEELVNMLGGQSYYYYGWHGPANIGLNTNLGLQIRDDETGGYRQNMLLRLGLQAQTIQISGNYARIEERIRIDTLISNSNGGMTYIDSMNTASANISQRADMLNLDVSFIFQTDRSKQWSLYGGGGISLGASVNAFTEVNHRNDVSYDFSGEYVSGSMIFYEFLNWQNEYERFKNKINLASVLYLPMGVDMRLGNHKEFWKRLHLFYEFRPELAFHYSSDTGSINAFKFSHGAGFTVRF